MSALPPKADICSAPGHVCFGQKRTSQRDPGSGNATKRVSSYCRKASPQSPVEAQRRSSDMDEKTSNKHDGNDDWLEAELADNLDEDYELELSEPALSE